MREFKSISSDLNEQVPTDWEVTKLNLVANLRRGPFGGALKVDSFVPEGYAVYEQQHAIHKKLSNIRYFINENKYKEMLTFKVEVNDILLSCSGTIGESVVIPTDYKEGIINQALLRIRLFRADLNINYFKYYMDSFLFQTLITDNSHGSAMKNIASMNVINKIPVPVPTKNEQEKIVLVLDSKLKVLDKTIEMKYKMLELLEQQRQSIITETVTKGLNPNVKMKESGVEWIGEVPEHWGETKLKFVIHNLIDAEHKTAPYELDGGYLVARTTNIKKGKLILNDAKYTDYEGYKEWTERGVPQENDVLLTREAPAGEACVVPKEPILCLGQRVVLLKLNSKINSHFLVWSIYGGVAATYIKLLSQGSTVSHFNMADIKNIPLLLPNIDEQNEIVKYINEKVHQFDELIRTIQNQIEMLKEYRQALIYEAVTGKIDVRDMELD